MRKFNFKFDRQVEGTEACSATVLATNKDEAYLKFNNQEWSTFLIEKRNIKTDMSDNFVTDFKELSVV